VQVWGLIPARGGSKSIPLKNLAPIAGRPMLEYVAALAGDLIGVERVIGSTDHSEIANVFEKFDIDVHQRSVPLSGDSARVDDLARAILKEAGDKAPDAILLMQPTSPFCRAADIHAVINELESHPDAMSVQTITSVPHNYHEWNQRHFVDGVVDFVHKLERQTGYRKQSKPHRWIFGNVVITRSEALLRGENFFAGPSRGIEIERLNSIDVDGADDLVVAEALYKYWHPDAL
jgi:CMP-N,N'-diacetyllegionaminic acid synthase